MMDVLSSLHNQLGTWVCSLMPIFHLKSTFLASVKPHSSILKIYKTQYPNPKHSSWSSYQNQEDIGTILNIVYNLKS